jgi:hypothetical protein
MCKITKPLPLTRSGVDCECPLESGRAPLSSSRTLILHSLRTFPKTTTVHIPRFPINVGITTAYKRPCTRAYKHALTMFAGIPCTFPASKAATNNTFRHCAVGHSSPDQFQFWLVTLIPKGTPLHSVVGLRPATRQAVVARSLRDTLPAQIGIGRGYKPTTSQGGTLHKVPSPAFHSHSSLSGDGD